MARDRWALRRTAAVLAAACLLTAHFAYVTEADAASGRRAGESGVVCGFMAGGGGGHAIVCARRPLTLSLDAFGGSSSS
ncbi:hypothetical protein ACH3VR_00680 [Microbacterium sp. B2969]|uniref:Uncharacterized protein n=1 Tax=Microbacterium alkaliflavum TaxID=3248839 RepID=A0ABW7Q2G4_9MICO